MYNGALEIPRWWWWWWWRFYKETS